MADTEQFLSFEQILAAPDLVTDTVKVPEWGGSVRVRAITQAERDQVVADATVGTPTGGQTLDTRLFAKYLLAAGLDSPLCSRAQVEALWAKSTVAVERCGKAVLRLNGIGGNGEASPEAVAAVEAAFRGQPDPALGDGPGPQAG